MGQQRLQADDADRKARMQQAEQENAYRLKALEQQTNMQTQSAANAELALAADLLYRNAPGSEGHSYGQSILARRLGPKPELPKTAEQLAADANIKALADKAKREGTPGRDITMVAENYGNKAQNVLADAVNMIMGNPIGESIPTPFQNATAQFVSDAQYNTNKHFENQKRIREGRPTIEQEAANVKPAPPSWYDFPTQILNAERAQAVEGAQAQTAEYLKRKAALRQAAGFQPKY